MSAVANVAVTDSVQLPHSLRSKLRTYRWRVWCTKMAESLALAASVALVAFLLLFVCDRLVDTADLVRWLLWVVVVLAMAGVPWFAYRWVWLQRRPEHLARLIQRRLPALGDEILGAIEIAENGMEISRSRQLCEAAVHRVAASLAQHDLRSAAPTHRLRHWLWSCLLCGLAAMAAGWWSPQAAANAWARLLAPWKDIPRYTFTRIVPLPERIVVPHGEPSSLSVALSTDSKWQPSHASLSIPGRPSIAAASDRGKYSFAVPPLLAATAGTVRVGDVRQRLTLEPMHRPQLVSLQAEIVLPDYLERPQPLYKDARSGRVTAVRGSQVRWLCQANRALEKAWQNTTPVAVSGSYFRSQFVAAQDVTTTELTWRDVFGLECRQPIAVEIDVVDDEPPSLTCEGLPSRRVVLDEEQLNFQVHATDDFGVRRVGFEWQMASQEEAGPAKGTSGDRILSAGDPDAEKLTVTGTFCAKTLGVPLGVVEVRPFVEDYYPDRGRVYGPRTVLHILDAEQHAIWLTEQLNKWHRLALEVRDRELQLYETNKELRALKPEQLNDPQTRRRIESQAAAERANARRLETLTTVGEDLVQQAMRNPQFGVGHLEKWAEMLQILKDIAGRRMPSVADLLHQAAAAPVAAGSATTDGANRRAGTQRDEGSGAGAEPQRLAQRSGLPQIVDIESTQQPLTPSAQEQPDQQSSSSGSASLRLPQTSLLGGGPSQNTCPVQQSLEQAVAEQEELLAEFDKIADELNRVLASLEGSTLVKRLKAAARLELRIANRLVSVVGGVFGSPVAADAHKTLFEQLSAWASKNVTDVSNIMDDMQSYFERRRLVRLHTVLEQMRTADVLGGLRTVEENLTQRIGLATADAEFWSDALDRWAEELVEAASGGT